MPEAKAKRNLSTILSALRKQLDPYLHVEPQTITFNREAPHHLDVTLFQAHLHASRGTDDITPLQQAVDLYQGDYLAGLYVKNAYVFEEWVLAERERLRELILQTLDTLVSRHLEQAEYLETHKRRADFSIGLIIKRPELDLGHNLSMGSNLLQKEAPQPLIFDLGCPLVK